MKFINHQRIKSLNLYNTYFFLLILFFHFTNLFSQNKVDYHIDNLEIPKLKDNEVVIRHTGFSLSYNEKHEQANWVAYELTGPETVKLYERTNKFLLDPKIESGTANDTDYLYSGYDKGHLAPAGDMGWSETTMSESFYYSNMSPQDPAFNRGIWKKLEDLVRVWAVENNSIYIVTGPILQDSLRTLGMNEVSIPKYFYMSTNIGFSWLFKKCNHFINLLHDWFYWTWFYLNQINILRITRSGIQIEFMQSCTSPKC